MAKPNTKTQQPKRAADLRRTVISCITQKLSQLDMEGLRAVLSTAENEMDAQKKGK